MDHNKSLDELMLITALTRDVAKRHEAEFCTQRAVTLTLKKLKSRVRHEGIGFLTKALPRLAKALDRALSGDPFPPSSELGFEPCPDARYPKLFGELWKRILHPDGTVLRDSCPQCVRSLRQILYLFYKYELPYSTDEEQRVINNFKEVEDELRRSEDSWTQKALELQASYGDRRGVTPCHITGEGFYTTVKGRQRHNQVAREARILVQRVFASMKMSEIIPSHGPGAVSTRERLWEKYEWRNVSSRITDVYPFDAYFCASSGHVCDSYREFSRITSESRPARVILVPKDSRGPRLISCEPVDNQWIQQGISRLIVECVEKHDLTRDCVFFTDQTPNKFAALMSSRDGRYATLDLKDASDRVSLGLVRLLFPEHVLTYLECCRSQSTVLPNGEVLNLHKFAPMGSALCFPVMALTIWSILAAGAPDAYSRERIHVYGDDVIVPIAYASDAIELLESFGLKINRDKSCINGFFRESCGTDAYKGVDVTPVRIRTRWSSSQRAESYASWIAYANSLYARKYYHAYDYIVGRLLAVYRQVPTEDHLKDGPRLIGDVPDQPRFRSRIHRGLQKRQYYVRVLESPVIRREIRSGWPMLLRYFTEGARPQRTLSNAEPRTPVEEQAFSVRSYTRRKTSMLVWRWR